MENKFDENSSQNKAYFFSRAQSQGNLVASQN